MTLPYREQRLLRRVDRAFRRSDPALVSLLSAFCWRHAAEAMPARERLRPRASWAWCVLLSPVAAVAYLVAAVAFLVVFAAGGGVTDAAACGAAPVRWVRELRAALATPTVMASLRASRRRQGRRPEERISGRRNSRNGPFGRGILKAFSPERTLISRLKSSRVAVPAGRERDEAATADIVLPSA
jgi:hypothetical protein